MSMTPKRKGIVFLCDEKGRPKVVQMSYRAYRELMEDLEDLAAIAECRDEPTEPLEKVLSELRDAGRLPS